MPESALTQQSIRQSRLQSSQKPNYRSWREFQTTAGRTPTYKIGYGEFAPSFDMSKLYSVQIADDQYADIRFEVRPGDRYVGDKDNLKERSELAASEKVSVGEVWGIYDELLIPKGQTPNSPKSFNTLIQVHSGHQMNSAPPFFVLLDYDDLTLYPFLKFLTVQRTTFDGPAKLTEVARINILYGKRIHLLVRGMCSGIENGGALTIYVNGKTIFKGDKVPMGYLKKQPEPDYAKFGIYRGANGGPPLIHPLVVYHRNFRFGRWSTVQAYMRQKPWR